MKFRFLLVSLFSVFLPLLACADDPLPRAQPESVGLSSVRLERIGQVMRADVERGRLPGAVLAVARRGRLVYFESFGYLDKSASVPMPKDAIFAVASMTKPMTGVGVMQLVEEGRIAIGDPISKWFPALGKMPVAVLKTDSDGKTTVGTAPANREMRIHDLLRHTSGLTYASQGSTPVHKMYPFNALVLGANFTGPELIERLSGLTLLYQPGSTWEYGASIDVLGLVIEAESRQTLGAFLQERLWKPLGMVDTSFVVPPEKAKRYAKALPNDPDTGRPQTIPDRTRPTKMECGGGCAASTAGDYLRFAQMLLDRGKLGDARVLGAKTVDYMTADHLGPEIKNNVERGDPAYAGYGFGLTVAVRKQIGISSIMGSPGDFSWQGSTGPIFWVDPKEQLVVVFMAHIPGSAQLRLHYRRLVNALVLQSIVD
jgi:CubicO group peptidase (beta-lactamase class C family)